MKKIWRLSFVAVLWFFLTQPSPAESATYACVANRNSDAVSTIAILDRTFTVTSVQEQLQGIAFIGVAITPDGYVYVANPDANAVYVLDTSDGELIHTLEAGKKPVGVTASPNGRFVYVTNWRDNTVSVIDTGIHSDGSPEVVGPPIQVGRTPIGVAVSPDGRYVYVANYHGNSEDAENGSLSVITAPNGQVLWTVEDLGKLPVGVAVSPDGGYVYITNLGDDTVSVIDTNTREEVTGLYTRIKVGRAPMGVAVSPSGDYIYVASRNSDSQNGTVSVIQTADDVVDYDVVKTVYDVGKQPVGVSVTPDGAYVYVTCRGDDTEDGTVSVIRTSDYNVESIRDYEETEPASFGQFIGSISVPEEPTELVATAVSDTQISLSWTDNSFDELGFRIERKTGLVGTYAEIASVEANAVTYTDMDLSQATTYYYRITAYNSRGDSSHCNEGGGTTYPAAPGDLLVEAVSASQIILSWTDNSSGESGFGIERRIESVDVYTKLAVVDANVTTYSDTGLSEATTYYYRITAYDSIGSSGYSDEDNATTRPAAPGTLSAKAISTSQIDLSWTDNSLGESGFEIERRIESVDVYTKLAVVDADVTTYSDTGLSEATTCYYRITAYDSIGSSGYSDEDNATTYLLAPSGLSATAVSSSRIDLSWTNNSSKQSGFRIERKIGLYGTHAEIAIVDANIPTYSDTGLTDCTVYYYRVRAYSSTANSSYSDEDDARTFLAAPSGLSATAVSRNQIDLTWTDNSTDESGFKIERKTASETTSSETDSEDGSETDSDSGTYSEIATVGANVTKCSDSGLEPNTTYRYRVRTYTDSETTSVTSGTDVMEYSDYSNEGEAETSETSDNCFIATAAFGSLLEPHVATLRKFRDAHLLPCASGRMFVKTYYAYSPPIADFIARHDTIRAAVRIVLLPTVAFSYSMLHVGPMLTLIIIVFVMVLPLGLSWLFRRKSFLF
ncbi:MAG: fibronectin type III domain-containing protein [Deltaproteobacteria bacterium]|nr:fibronectin type III domain-containing protein [Deltaproteobacteria bacterium]